MAAPEQNADVPPVDNILPKKRMSDQGTKKNKRMKKREKVMLEEIMKQTSVDDLENMRFQIWKNFGREKETIRKWTDNRKDLLKPRKNQQGCFSAVSTIILQNKTLRKGCCIHLQDDEHVNKPYSICSACDKFVWHDRCQIKIFEDYKKQIKKPNEILEKCPNCVFG